MGKLLDFLWWWRVEPSDDWPHLAFTLAMCGAIVFIVMLALFIEGVGDKYVARARWRNPARPYERIALYLAIGGVIGAVSSFVLAKPAIPPTAARYASLLVGPLLAGIATSVTAYWRGARKAPSPRLAFWYGFALALGLVMMRVAIH